jgi:3-phosphoshikimate 1-carboxyvinyltransferase
VRGAQELRVKESDRIATVVQNLRAIGARAEETPDGFTVHGSRSPLRGLVRTRGDHRVAMAFGVLASLPGNDIEIDDRSCVAVSYPRFWDDLAHLTR